MAPATTQICSQLRQVIWYHLDNDLLDNAVFLAGRLHAIDQRNADSVHLLALCHFRLRELKAAYDYTRTFALKREHIGCSYVFAQACLGLERHSDGIAALERARTLWEGKDTFGKGIDVPRRQSLDASAFHCLLGKLLHGNGDIKRAVNCYVSALRLNPYMWDAYERLCDTGATIRPANIFKDHNLASALIRGAHLKPATQPSEAIAMNAGQHPSRQPLPIDHIFTPGNDPFNSSKALIVDPSLTIVEVKAPSRLGGRVGLSSVTSLNSMQPPAETPPAIAQDDPAPLGPIQLTRNNQMEPPNAPTRRARNMGPSFESQIHTEAGPKSRPTAAKTSTRGTSDTSEAQEPTKPQLFSTVHGKRTISGTAAQHSAAGTMDPTAAPQRRSGRLNKQTSTNSVMPSARDPVRDPQELRKMRATGTRGRAAAGNTVGRVVSGNRKPIEHQEGTTKNSRPNIIKVEPPPAVQKPMPDASQKDAEATKWILDLLCKLGTGYYALSRYQCQQAVQILQSVPSGQRDTPWVLAIIGRAQFENTDHASAEKTFAKIRKLAPSRIKDMETYSTLLWHLKSDLELAFLSHEVVESDRSSPEAWCTIGNSFSLQRDHEQALKCFRRATQLSPSFAYGYTLQGHEHVANEDFDKALLSYRKAISAHGRHYNGWYGIGRVYERLGKYDMAEKHYRAAANINPTNAILVCHIGTVLDKQNNHRAALSQYNHACILAPHSAIARFRRSRTLLRLRMYHEALAEFLVLKDMAPDEANVHFMLGRTYKMLGDKGNAIRHLTVALNLDPKAGPLIKDAMEALGEDDISDEGEDDEAME